MYLSLFLLTWRACGHDYFLFGLPRHRRPRLAGIRREEARPSIRLFPPPSPLALTLTLTLTLGPYCPTASGQPYFHNRLTGETTWRRPAALLETPHEVEP